MRNVLLIAAAICSCAAATGASAQTKYYARGVVMPRSTTPAATAPDPAKSCPMGARMYYDSGPVNVLRQGYILGATDTKGPQYPLDVIVRTAQEWCLATPGVAHCSIDGGSGRATAYGPTPAPVFQPASFPGGANYYAGTCAP